MDSDNNFVMEDEMLGTESVSESAPEWSCPTQQTPLTKTRKRPREPTVKIEDTKKMGRKQKVGEGAPGWVRPLFEHDDEDHLLRCSPPSSVAGSGKKGAYVTCLICHQKVSFNKYS